jgi:hypothetical protein
MSRYEVSTKKYDCICVIDTEADDEFLTKFPRESGARVIADLLNEKEELLKEKPLDLHKDFEEWDSLITNLKTNESELISLKQIRDKEEMKILNEVDFKEIYGKNNETIRKNHIKNELSDIFSKITSLELVISDEKRRVAFLQSMINMKIELIKYGECDAKI